jgi:hypothetical protein
MMLGFSLDCILSVLPEPLEKFVPESLVCRNMSYLSTISIKGRYGEFSCCCFPNCHQLSPHQRAVEFV